MTDYKPHTAGDPEPPAPPAGLRDRGAAYWRAIVADNMPNDSETELLLEACRTLDNLDALAEAVARDGATTLGSAGQIVVHPALTEARGQRIVLHRLMAALDIPDEEVTSASTTRARTAARASNLRRVK